MIKADTAVMMARIEAREGYADVFDCAVLSDWVSTRSDSESVTVVAALWCDADFVSHEAVTL